MSTVNTRPNGHYVVVKLVCGLLTATATIMLLALSALPALAQAGATSRGLRDPRHDRRLSPGTVTACESAPNSPTCIELALQDINAARASEGVRPMRLPRRFASLTGPQQLMVLSNLERIGRGLPAILGLAAPLDRDARAGALGFRDPYPSHLHGDAWSANFAYGFNSTLESDFEWMYDDGYRRGGFNYDCQVPHAPGCWGHRHDILAAFGPPVVMGAAVTHSRGWVEMSELFVFGDRATGPGQPDHPLAPTWSSLRH